MVYQCSIMLTVKTNIGRYLNTVDTVEAKQGLCGFHFVYATTAHKAYKTQGDPYYLVTLTSLPAMGRGGGGLERQRLNSLVTALFR